MFCALSGVVPTEPVVSSKSGPLFERRLVVQQLRETGGKCPVTGQDLAEADLVAVQVAPAGAAAPRPSGAATSIPALLDTFRNEWDAVVLESHSLRGKLLDARQQLSVALYEKDAARRVIAKLLQEREELKKMVVDGGAGAASSSLPSSSSSSSQSSASSAAAASLHAGAVTVDQLVETNQALMAARAARRKPEGWTPNDVLKTFTEVASRSPHKSSARGILALALHRSQPLLLSGGVDKQGKLLHTGTYKVQGTLEGHSAGVTCTAFARDTPVTASEDGTVKVWSSEVQKSVPCLRTLAGHAGAINSLSTHALLPFAVTASATDGTWRSWDLETGACVFRYAGAPAAGHQGVQRAALHPDGIVVLGALSEYQAQANAVVMWDMRTPDTPVASFGSHDAGSTVTAQAFSENGYHLATGGVDGVVKLWDMRKPGQPAAAMGSVSVSGRCNALSYGPAGKYLACCGNDGVDVYAVKKWGSPLLSLHGAHAKGSPVMCAAFNGNASWLVSGSMDRTIKFFGAGGGDGKRKRKR